MPQRTAQRLSSLLTVVALAALVGLTVAGCGVSGEPSDRAAPSSSTTAAPDTAAPPTSGAPTTGTSEPTGPTVTSGTTPRDSSDTTIPDATAPDTTVPFDTGDIRNSLIRIYKQSGFTDKEARCVTDLIVKRSDANTIDPDNFDFSKLRGAATKCFGADGVPGGSD